MSAHVSDIYGCRLSLRSRRDVHRVARGVLARFAGMTLALPFRYEGGAQDRAPGEFLDRQPFFTAGRPAKSMQFAR